MYMLYNAQIHLKSIFWKLTGERAKWIIGNKSVNGYVYKVENNQNAVAFPEVSTICMAIRSENLQIIMFIWYITYSLERDATISWEWHKGKSSCL